jgi:hypothetical protein
VFISFLSFFGRTIAYGFYCLGHKLRVPLIQFLPLTFAERRPNPRRFAGVGVQELQLLSMHASS